MKLPDFPILVNFPEHLTRGQTRGTGEHKGLAPEGKRHCVMCGQLRICSSTANRLNRSTAGFTGDVASNDTNSPFDTSTGTSSAPSSSGTVHIIPRQNKGVCTACDVTVWTVVKSSSDGSSNSGGTLEIKWCKGCKNFRPWPAFGDKGMATKCARCRHRQREKYALQKKQNGGHTTTATTTTVAKATSHFVGASPSTFAQHIPKEDDLLAAQGLSNLMRAQNA